METPTPPLRPRSPRITARFGLATLKQVCGSNDNQEPWPEEINRKLTARIADVHFAPSGNARANLIKEGISEDKIVMTGNTIVDALLHVSALLNSDVSLARRMQKKFGAIPLPEKRIVATSHRRESFDGGIERVCRALEIVAERPDVRMAFLVHPNPNIKNTVHRILRGNKNVHLIEPLDDLLLRISPPARLPG